MPDAPLAFGQDLLFSSSKRGPSGSHRTLFLSLGLTGDLDVTALVSALESVVNDHDALRAAIHLVDGVARQFLRPAPAGRELVHLEQVLADSREQFEAYAAACFVDLMRTAYDPAEDYPFHFTLLRYSPSEHLLIGVFSHLFFDGRSLSLLPSRIRDAYDRLVTGSAADRPAGSFLETARRQWERYGARARTANAEYWRDRIGRMPAWAQFAGGVEPIGRDAGCRMRVLQVPWEASGGLRAALDARRVTAFQAVTWSFAQALFEVTPQDRLAVAVPVDSRDRADANVLGSFAGVLPVLIDRAASSLPEIQREVLQAVYHRHVPGGVVRAAYADLARRWGAPGRPRIMLSQQDLVADGTTMDSQSGLVMRQQVVWPNMSYIVEGVELLTALYPQRLTLTLAFHEDIFSDEAAKELADGVERRLLSLAGDHDTAGFVPAEPDRGRLLPVRGPGAEVLMWADAEATAELLAHHPAVSKAAVTTADDSVLHARVYARTEVSAEELRAHLAAAGAGRQFVVPPQAFDITVESGAA